MKFTFMFQCPKFPPVPVSISLDFKGIILGGEQDLAPIPDDKHGHSLGDLSAQHIKGFAGVAPTKNSSGEAQKPLHCRTSRHLPKYTKQQAGDGEDPWDLKKGSLRWK